MKQINIFIEMVIYLAVDSKSDTRQVRASVFINFQGMLRPIFCVDINTHSDRK